MKSCAPSKAISLLLAAAAGFYADAFTVIPPRPMSAPLTSSTTLRALPEKVEVCGSKDCRRSGGGARLEKLISTVLEENNLVDAIKVEGCDCQGECGYGPNLLIDGKIVNSVKGKDAVVKALGIEINADETADAEA